MFIFNKNLPAIRLIITISTILIVFAVVVIFQVIVDPFGLWDSLRRRGFNNFKTGQLHMDRTFKPYQYVDRKPEIVFIGTSRVEYGIPPLWPGIPTDRIYNFGIGAMPIREETHYTRLFRFGPKPRIVVIGLDLSQFNGTIKFYNEGFSKVRLHALHGLGLEGKMKKVLETILCFDAIKKSFSTIKNSKKWMVARHYDEQGWFIHRGLVDKPKTREYRHFVWRYINTYFRYLDLKNKSFARLKKAVAQMQLAGIQVIFFTTPYSADLQMVLEAWDKWGELEKLKRKIVQIGPLWDFANINAVTTDRTNYSDGSHYLGKIGAMIIDRISISDLSRPLAETKDIPYLPPGAAKPISLIKAPEGFGVYLTKDNIETLLPPMRKDIKAWARKEAALFKAMKAAIKNRKKNSFQAKTNKHFTFPTTSKKTTSQKTEPSFNVLPKLKSSPPRTSNHAAPNAEKIKPNDPILK